MTGGTKTSAVEVNGRPIPTMGERIRHLIEHVRKPDGKKYTQGDIAEGVTKLIGKAVDPGYVSAMIHNRKENPTRAVLQGLASFFAVPASYFFDDEQSVKIIREIDTAVALRDPRTRELALQLLRNTEPADTHLVAEVVAAMRDRPALRAALTLMASLDEADLQAAVAVLDAASRYRGRSEPT
ncbi:hypothetical protein [Amycolatopsis sp. NPDC051102]|uniref:helix-turn-helix domain-containing protein n=1 Tax=Amycolatopsis sp. NPDC051102 TaxID=3155163 RepID=UPI00341AAA88